MTKKFEIYKCEICGQEVEVITDGAGTLVCCGEEMKKLEEQTTESEYSEKHLPVLINEDENCQKIQVGQIIHPMTKEHYIEFIEVFTKDKTKKLKKFFSPEEEPILQIPKCFDIGCIRAYCNIHGLWKTEI